MNKQTDLNEMAKESPLKKKATLINMAKIC